MVRIFTERHAVFVRLCRLFSAELRCAHNTIETADDRTENGSPRFDSLMRILFLHGWRSVPGGVKPTYLRRHGHDVINPQLDDDDFDAAVKVAQSAYDQLRPDIVVGSSRGGAVAINMDSADTPLVLLCPAWKNWGSVSKLKSNSVILHSRADDVISFGDSEELLSGSKLPQGTLIEIGHDHRLADEQSLEVMLWACTVLTSGASLPWLELDSESSMESPGHSSATSQEEASYVCDACGEEIVIPLDLTEGTSQAYVEDCPVCCRANTIHVQFNDEGMAQVWAEPEQDYD